MDYPKREHHDEYEDEREYGHDHDRDRGHDHDRSRKHKKVCTVNTSEEITITTPVEIHAYANSRNVELKCNGYEIIKEHRCRPNVSKFKIRQKIHACIPVEFVVECEVGEGQTDFDFDEA